jgi:hypothetical protein
MMDMVIVVAVGKKVVYILCQQGQKKHSQQKQAAFPEGMCRFPIHRSKIDLV